MRYPQRKYASANNSSRSKIGAFTDTRVREKRSTASLGSLLGKRKGTDDEEDSSSNRINDVNKRVLGPTSLLINKVVDSRLGDMKDEPLFDLSFDDVLLDDIVCIPSQSDNELVRGHTSDQQNPALPCKLSDVPAMTTHRKRDGRSVKKTARPARASIGYGVGTASWWPKKLRSILRSMYESSVRTGMHFMFTAMAPGYVPVLFYNGNMDEQLSNTQQIWQKFTESSKRRESSFPPEADRVETLPVDAEQDTDGDVGDNCDLSNAQSADVVDTTSATTKRNACGLPIARIHNLQEYDYGDPRAARPSRWNERREWPDISFISRGERGKVDIDIKGRDPNVTCADDPFFRIQVVPGIMSTPSSYKGKWTPLNRPRGRIPYRTLLDASEDQPKPTSLNHVKQASGNSKVSNDDVRDGHLNNTDENTRDETIERVIDSEPTLGSTANKESFDESSGNNASTNNTSTDGELKIVPKKPTRARRPRSSGAPKGDGARRQRKGASNNAKHCCTCHKSNGVVCDANVDANLKQHENEPHHADSDAQQHQDHQYQHLQYDTVDASVRPSMSELTAGDNSTIDGVCFDSIFFDANTPVVDEVTINDEAIGASETLDSYSSGFSNYYTFEPNVHNIDTNTLTPVTTSFDNVYHGNYSHQSLSPFLGFDTTSYPMAYAPTTPIGAFGGEGSMRVKRKYKRRPLYELLRNNRTKKVDRRDICGVNISTKSWIGTL